MSEQQHEDLRMEYNSDRDLLEIPEYGRNVQKLIKYAKTIEEDGMRQAFVEKVVNLMMQLHPQNRNVEDYREKLWSHVFQIAGYDLKVLPPSGEVPKPEARVKRPEAIGYPKKEARFRHYGSNVQQLIQKAVAMEDGAIKDGFVEVIGSYMKLAYRTWNKDHYVSDEIIKNDLIALSKGKLALKEHTILDNLANSNKKKKKFKNMSNDSRDHHGRDRDRDRNDRRSGGRHGGRHSGGRRRY